MKTRRLFALAVTVAAVILLTQLVGPSAAVANQGSPRSGALHVTKECSQYTGAAGSFCTITGSNLNAIDAGMKVIYTSAANAARLDSDLVLDGPGHNDAYGHVTLNNLTATGVVTLSGGTGRFRGFHARVAVTYNGNDQLWHWDGTYSFTPPDHDE